MMKDFWNIFKESSDSFEGQGDGESVILLLRRHPFVALLPVSTIFTVALAPIIVFLVFYSYIMGSSYSGFFFFAGSLFYMILWLFAFYFLMMYSLNTVILTNRRIIEREQHGFFHRKVSELHIYRIQDVTVSTKGILPTFLHYGDVTVQTAGSEQKFEFHEMPDPEDVKNEIMKVVSMLNAGVKPMDVTSSAE